MEQDKPGHTIDEPIPEDERTTLVVDPEDEEERITLEVDSNLLAKDTVKVDPGTRLAAVVEALCDHCRTNPTERRIGGRRKPLPSREIISGIIEDLRAVLFPGYFGKSEINLENMSFHVGMGLDNLLTNLQEQVLRGLCFECTDENRNATKCGSCEDKSEAITKRFTARLPGVQKRLSKDIRAAFEGDPAATTQDEAILCYPGILAVTNYRLAHELYELGVPVIPRIMTELAHAVTGIDIHPGAQIGSGFFIDHGTGVVIGETCVIGRGVKLYQGVTFGAKSFPMDKDGNPVKGIPRHPIIEDNVTVYSNATVLGRITIGKGSVIGGNVWVTNSVAPGSMISQSGVTEKQFTDGAGI